MSKENYSETQDIASVNGLQKVTIGCLYLLFHKIEGFVPKSQQQFVLYINNPPDSS